MGSAPVLDRSPSGGGKGENNVGEKILLIVVLLLALYGLAGLLCRAAVRLLSPGRTNGIWVIPVSGHREDIEAVVREAAVRRACGRPYPVVLLDVGMDAQTRRLAETICRAMEGVELRSCGECMRKEPENRACGLDADG